MSYVASRATTLLACLLLTLAAAPGTHAQNAPPSLTGTWHGTLEAGGQKLTIVFHLDRGAGDTLTATMDVPEQGARGISASDVRATGDSLRLEVVRIAGVFEGARTGDGTIDGTWRQGGGAFPLVLEKGAPGASAAPARPQEPEPPFSYRSEDVHFPGGMGDVELAGTLTLPSSEEAGDGPHPAVVLVSGSGPQDRNSEVAGHKLFLVLADYLTRRGVAVLRYDERGVGASTGKFGQATTHTFASDARAALSYLRERSDELGLGKLGLIGMSEGGLVGPMLAAHHPQALDFLVLMAGPGVPGDEIIAEQVEQTVLAQGGSAETAAQKRATQERLLAAVTEAPDSATAAEDAAAILEEEGMSAAQARQSAADLTRPWYRAFLAHNPLPPLREMSAPVLALFGEKDRQVPPTQNAAPLREALSGNPDATVKVLPGLNHLLQPAETGAVSEYRQIETTMAPKALEMVADWIAERTRAGGRE